MKVVVPASKPRNPFAVLARQRRGGAHRGTAKTRRQSELRALRREIRHAWGEPPGT